MLHAALTETAEEQLGTEIRRQPDWFREVTHLYSRKKFYMANGLPQTVQLTCQSFGELVEEPAKLVENKKQLVSSKADEAHRASFSCKDWVEMY